MALERQQAGSKPNGSSKMAEVGEPKSAIAVPDAVDNPLSEREMEVSCLVVTGATNAEIARALVISPHTVKVHLRNVFEKLDVNSRTEASMVLLQRGWVVMPGVDVPERPVSEVPIPEPEPLADLGPQPQGWQFALIGVMLAVSIVALMLPVWFPRPKSATGLLSDSGQTVFGPPALEMLPRWESVAPLDKATTRMASAQTGDILYVVGGEDADGATLDVAAGFDLRNGTWFRLAALPNPRANAAAAWSNGNLYIAGGSALNMENDPAWQLYDDLLRYDPDIDRWQRVGRLPMPLAGAALAAYDGDLYLLGGWDGTAVRDEMWQLSTASREGVSPADWDVVTQLPHPVAFFGAVVVDRVLYVAGGYDGRREVADAARYDLRSNVWQRLPSLNTPRSGLGLVDDGVSVVALGGGWTRIMQSHERLDTVTNQWVEIESPVRGEWRHFGTAAHEGNIFIIGGWSGDYLATNLRFQSTFRAMLPVLPQGNE